MFFDISTVKQKILACITTLEFLQIHSVSKETHHKFIDFRWNPGSRSGDPGRVVFYHKNLKQVAKNVQNANSIGVKEGGALIGGGAHSSAKETQLSMVRFF